MLFTPYDKKGISGLPLDNMDRVHLNVAPKEMKQFKRGRRWRGVFFDKKTKRSFLVRSAGCGIPHCYCAAAIVKEV